MKRKQKCEHITVLLPDPGHSTFTHLRVGTSSVRSINREEPLWLNPTDAKMEGVVSTRVIGQIMSCLVDTGKNLGLIQVLGAAIGEIGSEE